MSFLPMRNMPAGKHEPETHLSTTLQYWTLGFVGKSGHMENIPLSSAYMRLIFVLDYFYIYFSLRFSNKYKKEVEHYTHLRDSIADFETDYPGLATSSRAVNKLAKVVSSTPNFIVRAYHSDYIHLLF
jgi:hypothetical protein